MPKGQYERQPKPAPSDNGVRLQCLELASNRLLKAGQITDADAVIALAKKFEEYVNA
jgi:hypothetical protein